MLSRSRLTTLRWATSGIWIIRPSRSIRSFSSAVSDTNDLPSVKKQPRPPWLNRSLSQLWVPTGGITASKETQGDATALLIQAGYIRQSQSGVFHSLPLATLLEQNLCQKLSRLLNNELGASVMSLSALSSESLWRRSGRIGQEPLSTVQHQFLTVNDRKDSKLILSPTHEEEVTNLVANNARSYHDFPLRLYQIGRKYRDELRPRHGLLRTKEFTMKDLYTFDIDEKAALKTYDEVRQFYRRFFQRLGLPIVEAKASSGDMGGELSHEFHLLSDLGEDTLHICQSCGYAENEEVTSKAVGSKLEEHCCPQCSNKSMTAHKAIEIGHTFHLGTRYSEPLDAFVEVPEEVLAPDTVREDNGTARRSKRVPLQMGCHGIGISRLIGATAAMYADDRGLRWPLHVHPISIMIVIDGPADDVPGLPDVFNALSGIQRRKQGQIMPVSTWLDDRDRSLGWKLKDAELVGYPLTVVIGRKWRETGEYEIKCRSDALQSTTSKDLLGAVTSILGSIDRDPLLPKVQPYFVNRQLKNKALAAARLHPANSRETSEVGHQENEDPAKTKVHKRVGGQDTPKGNKPGPLVRTIHTNASFNAPNPRSNRAQRSDPSIQPWIPTSELERRQSNAKSSTGSEAPPTKATERAERPLSGDMSAASEPAGAPLELSREHLLEKVHLLERLFALQDVEKGMKSRRRK